MSEAGREIRRMRELRGLNQGELASLCGIPQSVISRAEGRNNLTIRTLERFAKAMKARLVVQLVPEESDLPPLSPMDQTATAPSFHGNCGIQQNAREIRRLAASITRQLTQAQNTEPSH